jgi:acetyl-CoA acyltransferase
MSLVAPTRSTLANSTQTSFGRNTPTSAKKENPTLEEHIQKAVADAFESTGIDPNQIDKGYIGNFVGELFSNQGHLGAMLAAAHPALAGKPLGRTEAACASGGIAVTACIDALQAGYDVVLAAGAEVQTTQSARIGADYLARASHYATEREIDEFTFPCLFARRTKVYSETYGIERSDIAHTIVKAYSNGNRNPYAHMRTVKMSHEKASQASGSNPLFLNNPEFRDHMTIAECSQVSDGASAMILASEEGLARLGVKKSDCTELIAYGQATSPLGGQTDLHTLGNSAKAAAIAYEDAGLTAADMQIAEVHDCFAITEIMMAEALGFSTPGKGADLAKEGHSHIDGRLPVNTGGGLMAFGHPVGATGVKQILEIFRQMKGRCGDYQVPSAPSHGITSNMGGDDRTTVVTIQRNID